MDGDLGGLGDDLPKNLRWWTAHAYVPPIFRGNTLYRKKCLHPIYNLSHSYWISGQSTMKR